MPTTHFYNKRLAEKDVKTLLTPESFQNTNYLSNNMYSLKTTQDKNNFHAKIIFM